MRSSVSYQLQALLSALFIVGCSSFPQNEVHALKSVKRAIIEDPLLVLSNWNPTDSNPCNWSGISCSKAEDHVIKLNISGKSVKGVIAPELKHLSYLQELILHGNLFFSSIPKEIGMLENLRILDLGSNKLTGQIPPEIGKLSSIVKINLESNGLTGKLPAELGNLKHLEELILDRNRLVGTFPVRNASDHPYNTHGMSSSNSARMGFCGASQLKVADFSFNFFVGSIPKCLIYLPKTSFQGNCFRERDPKQRLPSQCGGLTPTDRPRADAKPRLSELKNESKRRANSSKKPAWLLALAITIVTAVILLFVISVFVAARKWAKRPVIVIPWKKSSSSNDFAAMSIDSDELKAVARYSRQDLKVACEDFSNIIGSSPDSQVYKGTMKGGPEIAVISLCIKEDQWTAHLDLYFQKEVADLARLSHDNVGKFLGYCGEANPFTRMLVFEYASNGTLFEHLHYGEGCQFSWARRMSIIVGIARGLKYLHTELDPPFTISELNSNSIYLTDDFSPKLVDFECWKGFISRSEKSSGTVSIEGAVCTLPKNVEGRNLNVQSNIYAFGILLLEIVSGRLPYCQDKGCYLADWAKEYLETPEVMSYVVDPELKDFRYEDLKAICEVVSLCIRPEASVRASAKELCSMLERGIDTSVIADFKASSSSLAWAELALSS